MSERIGNINFGGEKYEISNETIALYKFMGHLAIYDHLFAHLDEDKGLYLFDTSLSTGDAYKTLAPMVIEK